MLNYSVHLCYPLQLGHIMCYFNENYNAPKNVLSITFQNLHGNMSSKGHSELLILTIRLFDTSTFNLDYTYISVTYLN